MSSTVPPPPLPPNEFEEALGYRLIPRDAFVSAIGDALRDGAGYAAGKLGVSERAWLYYPLLIERGATARQLRAFEQTLYIKATRLSGVFPADASFYREFAAFYAERLREVDCIGVALEELRMSLEVVRFHSLAAEFIRYMDQEPDRSSPANEQGCYLPHFTGKRVLLVCPYAGFLRERATKQTFEAVWAKTGKPWFEPAAVEAVEFPYGFARETHARYGTCLDLLGEIEGRIDRHDYDIALIGAGGLGVPLATFVRSRGKVGISLGGALQVLFGVFGERWHSREGWRERYLNDAWLKLPPKYQPVPGETDGDYW